jgi:excisionase family DNA binding protein
MDLTLEEAASALHRSPVAVRAYCSGGLLKGYRFRGRRWRIPRAALEAFQAAERKAHDTNSKRRPAA